MKYISTVLLTVFIVLTSCASRPPAIPVIKPAKPEPEKHEQVTEDPFAQALENIKMNTPLFQKTIKGGDELISGIGIKTEEDVIVTGEFFIDGRNFRVTYDLANAVNSGNAFQIPFTLENLTDNTYRIDTMEWSPAEDEAGLLLSLDDDYWYIWLQYFDMFDHYEAKVTFFVMGGPESKGEESYGSDMTLSEFCAKVLSRGHDIGFHTTKHLNLTKVTQDEFYVETIEGAKAFSDIGITFNSLAFPFGLSEPWMRETLAPFFGITRGYGTNIRLYNPNTIRSGYITSKAIDNIIYPDDERFKTVIHLLLLTTKFTGNNIIPLTTHDFSDEAQWGIKPWRLELLLKTAQELKLKFYTYSEVQRLFPVR